MAKRRRKRAGAGRGWQSVVRRCARLALIAIVAGGVIAGGHWLLAGGGARQVVEHIADAGDGVLKAVGMTVRDVTVTGRFYTSAQDILTALGAARGIPITAIDPQTARERVIALDWVREASVMRLYPNTIHVVIEEHEPLAIWRSGQTATLIDERGAVVDDLDVRSFPHLPLVVGAGAAEAAPVFLAELGKRPAISARVQASLRVGERRWSLRLHNGVIVHLPDEGAGRALDELIDLNERVGLVDRDIAVVDMRLPDRVTVLPGRDRGERSGANT